MSFLILMLKGFVIGIGKIVPGVSGSMIAILLGVYDAAIYYINNFFNKITKSVNYLFPVLLGIVLSVVVGSRTIYYLLNNYYLEVMSLFIGFMLGSFKPVFRLVGKINIKKIIIFFISFIIVLLPITFSYNQVTFKQSISNYFLIGIIDAVTMIIPGISGTAILMLIGLYDELLVLFSNIFYIGNIKYTMSYIFGLTIEFIMIIKLINFLFQKCKCDFYASIIGFSIASIFLLFKQLFSYYDSILSVCLSLMFFIVGFLITNFSSK